MAAVFLLANGFLRLPVLCYKKMSRGFPRLIICHLVNFPARHDITTSSSGSNPALIIPTSFSRFNVPVHYLLELT
ncbi:hypothetical protein NXH67_07955 [Butyrivibrio sp. DSM 10294]|uniref:hypothetical protein n=1 Tax=Butyrivibrio sp. DSM 10294 TaxID=2972457 RepID=UPI00234F0BF0|nr:hypothetical protein [Butyrivibrio sp. DSM 10294]MDC7293446.1 hypothetical protein [Butyrivibrio sp. DSM 10294]